MKSLSAITFAVAVTVSATAFAAPTKTSASAVTSGATSAAPSSSIGIPQNSSPSATSAATEGTTTGSLKQAVPSKWSADAYIENYAGVEALEKGSGAMAGAAFAGANYKINDKMKAYIRQNFSIAMAIDAKTEDKFAFADTELGLGLGKVVEWDNGKGGISLTTRLFLPTGKASIEAGQIARIREVVKTSYQLTKNLEVGHILDPRLHVQSRQSTIDAKGVENENGLVALPQYAFAEAKLNDIFSTTVAFGTYDKWSTRGTQKSESYLDIAGSAQLTKALALTLGVDNSANIGAKQDDRHAFFRGSETSYYMNLYATM